MTTDKIKDAICKELRSVVAVLEGRKDAGMIAPLLSAALEEAVAAEYRRFMVSGYEADGNTITFGDRTYGERTLDDMVDGDFFGKFRAWRRAHTDTTDRAAAFEGFMRDEGYAEFNTGGK